MGKAGSGRGGAARLVLASGARPKRRTGRPSDWSKAMANRFVGVLAETCNVTLATQAIGRSISNVYRRREKDASFRAAWDASLAVGYSRLELMLLERALHGVEKTVVARDGTTSVMREYPDRVALTLLRMHRETVAISGESVEDSDYQEARDRIVARLQRIRESEGGAPNGSEGGGTADGAVEHKQFDPLPLIRWGLRGE